MYLSLNWLKKYVNIPKNITPQELGLKLTMATVEIDGIEAQGELLEKVVLGKVLEIKAHPNADKLKLAKVFDGKNKVQVVCGGENLEAGQLVPFAKVGAKVRWHGEGHPVELEPVKIRGEKSQGMICASDEIGLAQIYPCGKRDILDLSNICKPGQVGKPLAKVLKQDDVIYEVDNKSINHRPDLWGHYGIAREIAAFLRTPLKNYNENLEIKNIKKDFDLKVKIKEPKKCFRYTGVVMKNITVAPSPAWLKQALESVGVRSINNIVDVTNYVMLDLGQPMHAFDSLKQKGGIIVRNAKKGEKIHSLDAVERKLDEDMLVIADKEKPIAIAGLMGGANTQIDQNSDTIILESANFDQVNIRRTSMKLGLRSESSMRFEKSLDPNNAMLALVKAVEMIKELCPEAEIASKVVDEGKYKLNQGPIKTTFEFLNKKIGVDIPKEKIISILKNLGFKVKSTKTNLEILVPTWRATKDISIPEDIVEEVARIYGYDNIETKMPLFPIEAPLVNKERLIERRVKNILAKNLKMNEVMNYAFNSKVRLDKIGINYKDYLEVENPIAKGQDLMCRSLIPNLINNIENNLRFFDAFKLFEISSVFDNSKKGPARNASRSDAGGEVADEEGKEHLPAQDKYLSGAIVQENDQTPFYEARKAVDLVLYKLGINFRLEPPFNSPLLGGQSHSSSPDKGRSGGVIPVWANPVRSADVVIGNEKIGIITELHPRVAKVFGIKTRVGLFELNFTRICELVSDKVRLYDKITEFPPVLRDLAIVVDKKMAYIEVEKILLKHDLVKQIEFFDIYEGKSIGEGKKSLAFHITYQSSDRTLLAEEVDKAQDEILARLKKKLGAMLR